MSRPSHPSPRPVSELRAARQAAGLTLDDLGIIVGASGSYLARVERGEQVPSVEVLCSIAAALGMTDLYRNLAPLVRRRSLPGRQVAS